MDQHERTKYVYDYYHRESRGSYFFGAVQSLLNCLTDEEISYLYFEYASEDQQFKKCMESYILKMASLGQEKRFNNIACGLLKVYKISSCEERYKIAVFVGEYIQQLPKSTIRQFFFLMNGSPNKYERLLSNNVAGMIWDQKVKKELLASFKKYRDENVLTTMIDRLGEKELYKIARECWGQEFPSYRLKYKIIGRIYPLPLNCFAFIKEHDFSLYLQVLALKKIKLRPEEFKRMEEMFSENNVHIVVWLLGLTGDWDLVKDYIEKLDKIEPVITEKKALKKISQMAS